MKIKPDVLPRGMGFFLVLFSFSAGLSFAASTEDWVRRTGNAVAETARGNPQGVLYQTLPGVQASLPTRASVYANPGGAAVRQPLPVRWNGPLGSAGAAYNAGTAYRIGQVPKIHQNVQIAAANRYVSNTTTFVPPSKNEN